MNGTEKNTSKCASHLNIDVFICIEHT